jgi:hypothetical protein
VAGAFVEVLEGTTPGANDDGTFPGAIEDGTKPGTSEDGVTPGAAVDKTEPAGALVDGLKPGVTLEGTTPGAFVEGTKPGAALDGTRPGAAEDGPTMGDWLCDRLMTKKLPVVLLPIVTSTVITVASPPSLSRTPTKPEGVSSVTLYTPGRTPLNANAPFEFVVVVAITVPLGERSLTITLEIGLSPTMLALLLVMSSTTTPLIARDGSLIKLFPVELPLVTSTTLIEVLLPPSTSEIGM